MALRDLMLNVMHLYEMPNERAATMAARWLHQWRLPIRCLARGTLLELGGNNTHIVATALKMAKAHGFIVRRRIPWRPPEIMHDDYRFNRKGT